MCRISDATRPICGTRSVLERRYTEGWGLPTLCSLDRRLCCQEFTSPSPPQRPYHSPIPRVRGRHRWALAERFLDRCRAVPASLIKAHHRPGTLIKARFSNQRHATAPEPLEGSKHFISAPSRSLQAAAHRAHYETRTTPPSDHAGTIPVTQLATARCFGLVKTQLVMPGKFHGSVPKP